ncbi:MAG: LemA family protein [Acholeplasmatales bacterium]|jgi:LemA protein|nr:LemA family protein [Acholeplasmatales bacterium]
MGWLVGGIILIAIALVLLAVLITYVTISNSLKKCTVKIDEALSGIDVMLVQRYDLLTKSIEVLKGAKNYEKSTIEDIVKLRKLDTNSTLKEREEYDKEISSGFSKINVSLEAYPNLKAGSSYLLLQKQISECEDNLQASRRTYNSNVSYYNQKLVSWPSSIIGRSLKLESKSFFEADENKKGDVAINL